MRNIFLSLLFLSLLQILNAQSNENIKLDLLKAPSSPASNLLGFATSDIEKPTDLSALMLSLQSNSSSFTKLPSNYAVDISPFFLTRANTKTDFTTKGLNSSKFGDYFKQTFVLSFAIRNPDSVLKEFKPSSTYTGFGFKFSIVRPGYIKKDREALNEIYAVSAKINNAIDDELKNKKSEKEKLYNQRFEIIQQIRLQFNKDQSEEFAKAIAENEANSESNLFKVNALINKINNEIIELISNDEASKAKLMAAIKKFGARRDGFSADLAGGLALDFRDRQFNNSKIHNAGIWATLGYSKGASSFLGLLRFLNNPDQIFAKDNQQNLFTANISTFDAGFRYMYSSDQSKFTCSVETIYRSVLSSNTISPSWRLIFNADYALWENQKLTFSFGRGFDGTITKDGTLVAALTFLTGFGNKR